MRVWVLFLLLAFAAGCSAPEPPADLTLIHATDPHLFEEPAKQRAGSDPEKPEVRRHKEKLNAAALAAFLEAARSFPGTDAGRPIVILTGDFGIDRSWTDQLQAPAKTQPTDQAKAPPPAQVKAPPPAPSPTADVHRRAEQVKLLADLLKAGSVSDLYVIPGNNDLENERATDDALDYVGRYFQDVQKELTGTQVTLHDLTACYQGKTASMTGCTADISGTAIRLVGFPSYSFKNGDKETYDTNRDLQRAQVEKFASLIATAAAQDRKVVVLSHIPDLDDPFLLARERFTGVAPGKHGNADRPAWSSWNVSTEVFRRWKDLVESPTVLAVLAGHFHDSHREIYRRPYRWSTPSSLRPDPRKLFLAPPLAVKLQETSPIQARGCSVLRIRGGDLSHRFHWFNADTSKFEPDPEPRRTTRGPSGPRPIEWLWHLGEALKPIERATIIALALLLAFLTVALLWEVPAKVTELTAPPGGTATSDKPSQPREAATLLGSNLGKTVVSGLTGLAAVSFLDPFWANAGVSAKAYYLIWFVILFFVGLTISALARGFGEFWRSRIAKEHRPPSWASRQPGQSPGSQCRWFLTGRFWSWVLSFRSSLLIFFDTALSVAFGQNVLKSAVLGDEILSLQWCLIRTVDRIRERIAIEVRDALTAAGVPKVDSGAIRVNVSVLSADEPPLSYVTWSRGSVIAVFPRNSLAWLSTYAGEPRWWKDLYTDETTNYDQKIVVLDNRENLIPGAGDRPTLRQFFQRRPSQDYQAFFILPIPWRRRTTTEAYWKAAIHISFRERAYLDKLWPTLGPVDNTLSTLTDAQFNEFYKDARQALDEGQLPHPALRAVLTQAIEALAELLRGFKPIVYEMNIRPQQLLR